MSGLRSGRVDATVDWERGIGDVEVPIAPGRTIAITPEVLAQEAAKEAARAEQPSSWAQFKSTLSEDNLRKRRVMVAPGRERIVPAKPKAAKSKTPRPKAAPSIEPLVSDEHAEQRQWFKQTFTPKPSSLDAAPTQPARSTMPPTHFTIGKPIPANEVPGTAGRGRASAYLTLLIALRKLDSDEFLPVDFSDAKKGTNATAALRKLAAEDKKDLIVRTDGLTRYYRLAEKKAPEQK